MNNEELYKSVIDTFEKRYSAKPLCVQSPARINIIGEHLDYNGGYVLPASIDKYMYVAISTSAASYASVYAADMKEELRIDLNNIVKQPAKTWKNYVLGVVAGIRKQRNDFGNFNMVFGSNIPPGAGLSSSAALENGIAFAINSLYNLGLKRPEIMDISIAAEHRFAGVKCGMMDQFSNLYGKQNHCILLDCETLSYDYIHWQSSDYQLLLIDSGVKHQLSDTPYNQRKEDCKTGFDVLSRTFPGLSSLSRASITQLEAVKTEISPRIYQRCRYVIEENRRVLQAREALKEQDWKRTGELLFASHKGLSEDYEVSCAELDFLVDLAQREEAVAGSRMMGGGFGGCTINLVHKDAVNDFIEKVKEAYFRRFAIQTRFYPVNISDGTKLMK